MKQKNTAAFLTVFLIAVFSVNAFCQMTLVLQPNAAAGKDAWICSYYPNDDNSTQSEFDAGAWTFFGNPGTVRSLVEFDLSSIPANAVITSAYLTLYNNPNSPEWTHDGTHSHMSGSNAAWLQRITTPWLETAGWNNQPSTTAVNEVVLLQDTNPHQDYVIPVTALVQDMINNPGASFGFMLRLQTELYYRILVFASSNHPNSALHPKIEICYGDPNGISDIINDDVLNVFPNPASNQITISNSRFAIESIDVFDMLGQKVYSERPTTINYQLTVDVSSLSSGIYFVKLKAGKGEKVVKFVKE